MDSHSHRRGADGIGSFVALMIAAALLAGAAAPGVAQPVTRVSIATGGGQSDGPSLQASFSAGGRHVAFSSYAGNLVPGDTNDQQDVFVHDSQTGQTTRVSIASDATQSDNRSFTPSISADGRYVAFASQATNLTALQPAAQQVYVHDRATGETTCVSVDGQGEPGDAASGVPSISADGRYVAFSSYADNFIPGDAVPGKADIYVRDRLTGSTVCASLAQDGTNSDGDSHRPSISANGRYVAFYSEATDLVPGDTNGSQDVFVHDLTTGQTSRVSVATGGAQADGDSLTVSISADGSCVAFESDATNLVAADTNGVRDVFAHDRTTGVTTRVSVSTHGAEGDRLSATPSISDDGRFVAFASPNNTTLVPGITKGGIYAHDRTTGHTSHVSTDDFGNQGVGASIYPSISGEGRLIAFESDATNLVTGDTNGVRDIFVRDWWPAQIVETGERYPSIETAIDAAVSGQTIEVAPGTCHEDVNFSGNNITLRSRDPNDPAVVAATVINGSGAGPVVTFANGETADAVLAGLTITGGGGAAGAGVHCTGSSPTISRNVIEGNEALGQDSAYGGGVYVSGGRPSIVNNTINSNRTRADVRNPSHGAGIFASASDVTITGNTITANNCWQGYKRGGGVYCVGGSPVITDNTIGENISWYGGGVYCIDSTITLTGNTIENNEVSVQGGGIYWRNTTGTIANNTIASNRNGTRAASDLGGGIFASQGSVSIRGNTIVGNVSTGGAGGLFCGADAEIIGNIISGNTGESQNTDRAGGGVYCSGARDITIRGNTMAANSGGAIELYASSPAIVNNTLHGNEATGGAGVNCLNGSSPTINSTIIASSMSGSGVAADGTSTPVIRYSNVFGNAGGNYAGMDDQTAINRNISEDPLFADAQNADFHLKSLAGRWTQGGWVTDAEHSPCIDTGDPATAVGDEPEPNADRVNMGAFGGTDQASKSFGTVLIVETGQRYGTIQAAINAAVNGQTLEVPAGTYPENINFAGKNITVRSENPADPAVVAATIIDGGSMGPVVTFANGETADAVLAGLTITAGEAQNGGGIYCNEASPTIQGNTVVGNTAGRYGGGIHCEGGRPDITGNTVTGNTAHSIGGGIYTLDADATINDNTIDANEGMVSGGGISCTRGTPVISGNTVDSNTARDQLGGGIRLVASDGIIRTNTIKANEAGTYGGGVYCYGSTGAEISSNTINQNTATEIGGGIFVQESEVAISENTITDNRSDGSGGGIRCVGGVPTISDNIVEGNTAGTVGGGINASSSDLTINGNLVSANTAVSSGGGGIAIYSNTLAELRHNVIVNNAAATYGGGMYINGNGPIVAGNTISGNTATSVGGGIFITNPLSETTITSTIVSFSGAGGGIFLNGATPPAVICSNVFGNTGGDYAGMDDQTGMDGNISRDPLFADAANADFHLKSLAGRWTQGGWVTDAEHSPCIDTGDPATAVGDEPAPNGGRVNMGAFGGTAEASKSAPAPTIAAIDPVFGADDGAVNVEITGTGFIPGVVATLSRQGESDIAGTALSLVDDATMTCTFDLNGAAHGEWHVSVTNYDGQTGTLDSGFKVLPPHAVAITVGPEGGPNPAIAGGEVACTVAAEDTHGHDLIYAWSAEGDAGSFDDPAAQNPTWTASAEPGEYEISVTVTCAEDAAVSDSASFTQRVEPVHMVTITEAPAGDPNPALAGGEVACTVAAEDTHDHDLVYAWSAEGGAGSFDDPAAQNPKWTAPAEPGEFEITVTVTCAEDAAVSDSASYTQAVEAILTVGLAEGWNMISLGQPADAGVSCAEVLDDRTVAALFAWRPGQLRYERLEMTDPAGTHEGCGLWALSREQSARDISVQSASPVTIGVSRGWNLLANPYETPLDLQRGLRPEGEGRIVLPAFTWNTDLCTYEQGTVAPAGRSFWVLCLYDGEAMLDPAGMEPAEAALSSVSLAEAPEGGVAGRLIQLVAATSTHSDSAVWLGTADDEAVRTPKPPMMPGAVGAYLDVAEGIGYARSLAPRGAEQAWTLTVNSPVDEEVSLRIFDTSHLPAEMAVWLSDRATGTRVDLRRAPEYTFTGREGQRRFEIELGERDDLLQVTGLSAQAAGGGAQINFTLSAESAVTVDVLSIAGRTVRRIVSNREFGSGVQTVMWNGVSDRGTRAPVGMYLVRVTAAATAGEQCHGLTTMRLR